MNLFICRGNLVKDTHFAENEKGCYCLGKIAVNTGKDNVSFIDFVAYEKTAEFLKEYGKKGQNFIFTGRIKTETKQENNKYYNVATMVVNQAEFGSSKASEDGEKKVFPEPSSIKKEQVKSDAETGDYLLDNEDDVPF